MDASQVQRLCVETRRRFYSLRSITRRGLARANRGDAFMWRNFLPINLMHRGEVGQRNHYPLGDAAWRGQLIEV